MKETNSNNKKNNRYKMFDWIPYLFGNEAVELSEEKEGEQTGETVDTKESEETSSEKSDDVKVSEEPVALKKKKSKKKRKGIDDENPVSFRTVTGPITVQQAIYFAVRDFFYATGPMFKYIWISLLCIIIGFPLSGQLYNGFDNYIKERSNLMLALGVVLSLRHLYKKSKEAGSTFFEDASLYHNDIDYKKILMGLLFGAGVALFLSTVLTLVPKVWVFATYDQKVGKIYQRYDILLTIIESACLTPLVEEIIFRGYMLNRLLRRWADLPALLVTTIVFSIMHGTSVWILYAFVMGLIIGKVSMIENNILYGIFIHVGFNLPSVIQWFIYFVHPELQATSAVVGIFQNLLLGVLGLVLATLSTMMYMRRIGNNV